MRVELQPCIILHRRAYRDTSLMLDVFSREYGRMGLVARGARRPKGRWRGVLEPLRTLRLSWSGRGEMQTLTAAESDVAAPAPRGDNLYGAFYGAELVLRLTARQDPYPHLFDRLCELITQLASGDNMAPYLRYFERDLLAELGYGVLLEAETDNGQPVHAEQAYYYQTEHGIRRADGRAEFDDIEISGACLLALANNDLHNRDHLRGAQRLLGAALAPHLGTKPLRSAQTLRALRRLQRTGVNNDEPQSD